MQIYHYQGYFENGSPARVNRRTGEVFLSNLFFEKYTPEQQQYILLHEEGHFVLNTKSEEEADRYAAEKMLDSGYGFKRTFRAQNNSLYRTGESDQRRISLFNYLKNKDMDFGDNDNIAVLDDQLLYVQFEDYDGGFVFQNNYIGTEPEADEIEALEFVRYCDYYGFPIDLESLEEYRQAKIDSWDIFSDATKAEKAAKKAKKQAEKQAKKDQKAANKQAKFDAKMAKKDAQTQKKLATASKRTAAGEAKVIKAQAKQTLADLGIDGSFGAKMGNVLGGIGNKISGMFGGGGDDEYLGEDTTIHSTGGGNSKMIIIIVVAVIALGVGGYFLMQKKK